MAKTLILPAAVIAAFTLTALPLIAQEVPAAPPAAKQPEAGFKVDFGAGRSVRIDCGTTEIAACLTAAQGVIDKVAATPPVEMGERGKFHGKHGGNHDRGDWGGKGKAERGEGQDKRGPGMDAPPPPADGASPEAPPVVPAP
ncbi:hypothetical protein [Neotabrizicola sp. sgz301269]|uniref:hypothetical protein n=1 Tax=Neotabrizicola sp. sgz301269 TaxID=3276282 RepID=UPI00376F8DEC